MSLGKRLFDQIIKWWNITIVYGYIETNQIIKEISHSIKLSTNKQFIWSSQLLSIKFCLSDWKIERYDIWDQKWHITNFENKTETKRKKLQKRHCEHRKTHSETNYSSFAIKKGFTRFNLNISLLNQ